MMKILGFCGGLVEAKRGGRRGKGGVGIWDWIYRGGSKVAEGRGGRMGGIDEG
jgi:hypothetical protein